MKYRLTKLKEKSGLTLQQIADKSGVSVSTVGRILSGDAEGASYRSMVNIIQAMGGSIDEIEGIEHPAEQVSNQTIELYERTMAQKDKWIKTLFVTLAAMVGVFVLIVLIDVLHGDIGFVRY